MPALHPPLLVPARADEDKVARRDAILDAAQALLERQGERETSMAQVAQAAGLAKGTIYLYFASREALLVALHERHLGAFFDELLQALRARRVFDAKIMARIVRRHLTDAPLYMPLAGSCMAAMDGDGAAAESVRALSQRVAGWMKEAGDALEARQPGLAHGDGLRLLVHGYALITGLWHLLGAHRAGDESLGVLMGRPGYADEAEHALLGLWAQMTGERITRKSKDKKK